MGLSPGQPGCEPVSIPAQQGAGLERNTRKLKVPAPRVAVRVLPGPVQKAGHRPGIASAQETEMWGAAGFAWTPRWD